MDVACYEIRLICPKYVTKNNFANGICRNYFLKSV